jgi:predicted dienelactone hydrolase
MVHSHGSGSIRWEMFYLMEFMASHGWLIAAPDHVGNTFYESWGMSNVFLSRRPGDVHDTFDWLVEQSADSSSPLAGCVDEDLGYVVSGYSFGGYTAYVTAGASAWDWTGAPVTDRADSRVTAVVTQAPWAAGGALTDGTADIDVPVLSIGAERDDTVGTDYLSLHSHITTTPRALASFFDAGHYSPVPIYCFGWGDGCGPDYVSSEVYQDIVKTSILAFVEHLRDREGAWEQIAEDADALSWETEL